MATPTPNKWNPKTTTVYSSRGSAKEIPIGDYDKFIGLGWGATAPSASKDTAEAITPEQLAPVELPEVGEPWQGVQEVFGEDWQPNPIFEELGLTEQGIYGAVRIKGMNDVYTIGAGGGNQGRGAETAESYKELFGTDNQQGIVGEISMEEAIALGITVEASSILEPLTPYEQWSEFRDEGKEEMDTLRANLKTATQTLIDKLMGSGEDKSEAKDKEKEKLGIDEKDKAITDAEKVHSENLAAYDKLLLKNRSESAAMSRILGTESRITAQRAIEMAPLSANILIAYKAYGRAKDLLDDWSNDYNQAMQFQMQAAQMNINMLEGELNWEQTEQLADAKIKFDMWKEDYNRQLETQEEVKALMLAFNSRGAGININDSWEVAYQKTMLYTKNDQEITDRLNELKLESAEVGLLLQKKALAKPSGGTGDKGTSDDLIGLLNEVPSYTSREEALTALNNYKTTIIAKVGEEGYNSLLAETDRLFPEVSEEENVGSDFNFSKEAIAKSRADLPNDVKIIYDKLKRENPYSSAAFLIRKALEKVGF